MPTDSSSPYMWRSACYEALIAGAINDYSSAIESLSHAILLDEGNAE